MNRKESGYVLGAKPSLLAWFSTLSDLVVSALERDMKFWTEVFLALFDVKQLQIDPKNIFRSFGGKTKSFCITLQVWLVFMPKVMKFWPKHF